MTSENPNTLSTEEAIKKLQKTIGQLETIVQQLDEISVIDLPSSTSIQNLVATSTELESIIAQKNDLQSSTEVQPDITPEVNEQVVIDKNDSISNLPEENKEEKIAEATPVESKNQEINSLPQNQQPTQNRKWLIIGLVGIILVITIPLSWQLFLAKQNPNLTELIAQEPEKTVISPNSNNSDLPPTVTIKPEEPEVKSSDTIENPVINQKELDIPSEITAINRPQKVTIETVKPNIQLTAEQNLISALERKVTELANNYNDEFIIAIEPDFSDNLVTVILTDDWYQMLSNRQDKIVAEMLKRSRQLEFAKLKVIDTQHNLIARSPVVGDDMVIFRRTLS